MRAYLSLCLDSHKLKTILVGVFLVFHARDNYGLNIGTDGGNGDN